MRLGKLFLKSINTEHRAQQTEGVRTLLARRKKTAFVNLPPGLTGYVQVVDVVVDKPFKYSIKSEKHLEDHVEMYTQGKLSASD